MTLRAAADRLGLVEADLLLYGRDKAKLVRPASASDGPRRGKIVLVSAITPTPAGEGKTTTAIGIADALTRLGHVSCLALREPSIGPCMGIKGGGAGAGRSRLVPTDDINLHFTGDFHAVSSAHNLLAAAIDSALHFGALGADARRVTWPRVLDMNDRSLREVIVGLGGREHGVPREATFEITPASELMAMLCLCDDAEDLRRRIDRTVVGFDRDGAPVRAGNVAVTGAMLALLRDALLPNLVQTAEGTPAFVHGGPFANIAHGCSSVIATRTAARLADWVVTEAGFGFDLGGEKFFDIKCRAAKLDADAVVLVVTARALAHHGAHGDVAASSSLSESIRAGLPNLDKQIDNVRAFGREPVVAINRFAGDTQSDIDLIVEACRRRGVTIAVSDHFERGGAGATELAQAIVDSCREPSEPSRPLYPVEVSVVHKIDAIAHSMYGADRVILSRAAERDIAELERHDLASLPVCIAKTERSLGVDPALGGRPRPFGLPVSGIRVAAGAGFLVVIAGELPRMPGLPRAPRATAIDLRDGEIVGLG